MAEYCPDVQTKIVDQMNAWDNEDCGTKPGDTEPNSQKCLYHVSLKKGNCTKSGKQLSFQVSMDKQV